MYLHPPSKFKIHNMIYTFSSIYLRLGCLQHIVLASWSISVIVLSWCYTCSFVAFASSIFKVPISVCIEIFHLDRISFQFVIFSTPVCQSWWDEFYLFHGFPKDLKYFVSSIKAKKIFFSFFCFFCIIYSFGENANKHRCEGIFF